ncbi:MAG: hypothetical protein EXS32_06830 [Opitutus sp.]|nr:hypothetical protein [Opitutus sp.]
MTSTIPTLSPASVFKKAGLRETVVLLALAWLVPFAIHLVPWSAARPLGAYLLPVFWTMLVAVYFYGAVSGLVVGLFAPLLNLAVTGLPVSDYFWKTSAEIVIFGLVMTLVVWRRPRWLAAAPLAYVIAKTVAAAVLTPGALFGSVAAFGEFFAHLATGNLPGLMVLAAINGALGWFYPKTETKPE